MLLQFRVSPYLARAVLFLTTAVLGMIGLRSILDPVGTAALEHIALNSSFAITVQQVTSGAFPIGAALFCLSCIFSRGTLRAGLGFVAVFMLSALAVRLYGVHVRGGWAENMGPLIGETVIGTLSLIALLLETRRHKYQADVQARPADA